MNYSKDGLHPNSRGYAVWANSISQYVINANHTETFTFRTPAPVGSTYAGTIWGEYQYTAGGPWRQIKIANVTVKAA